MFTRTLKSTREANVCCSGEESFTLFLSTVCWMNVQCMADKMTDSSNKKLYKGLCEFLLYILWCRSEPIPQRVELVSDPVLFAEGD